MTLDNIRPAGRECRCRASCRRRAADSRQLIAPQLDRDSASGDEGERAGGKDIEASRRDPESSQVFIERGAGCAVQSRRIARIGSTAAGRQAVKLMSSLTTRRRDRDSLIESSAGVTAGGLWPSRKVNFDDNALSGTRSRDCAIRRGNPLEIEASKFSLNYIRRRQHRLLVNGAAGEATMDTSRRREPANVSTSAAEPAQTRSKTRSILCPTGTSGRC